MTWKRSGGVSTHAALKSKGGVDPPPPGKRGAHLLVEGRVEAAHAEVALHRRLVDVLQAVPVRVHDEPRVVVEENAHAVVAQLVA